MSLGKGASARAEIVAKVKGYHALEFEQNGPFRPGVDPVPVSGRVFDHEEIEAAVGPR